MAASGVVGQSEREAFWQEQLSDWRAGLERAERTGRAAITVREFCRVRGLRESSFYFWRRELARREGNRTAGRGASRSASREGNRTASPAPGAMFAPVTVRSPALPAAKSALLPAEPAAPIDLEIAGVTLRILPGFDEATLARLIAVLRPVDVAQGRA